MVRSATALLLLPLAACFLQQKTGSDAGADGSATADGGATSPDASPGRDCATDPVTRTALCSSVVQCPELVINHDVFPNCGYRPRAGGYDLACWCNGFVCPMGSPTSCAETKKLVESQSEIMVCTQVNEGRCTQPQVENGGATTAGTTSGTSAGTKPGCNPECMKQCGYTPGCKDLCGC